ncbi:MAG: DegV family protein [Chloroflexota bacterium]
MGNRVKVFCDSCADLDPRTYEWHDVSVLPLHVHFGSEVYDDGVSLKPEEFYAKLAQAPVLPTTSCPSPGEFQQAFAGPLAAGQDIVYIGISSALSGSVQSALTARDLLGADASRVVVVDSLGASTGEGLLVLRACQLAEQGKSAAEIGATLTAERLSLCSVFTPDTLGYLRKGGRISGFAATAATILDIKPVMCVDETGHLVSLDKVRGRKRAVRRLVEEFAAKRRADQLGGLVAISHSRCAVEARELAETLRREYGADEIIIGEIGATIGTHTGPGCLALFFGSATGRRN